MKLLISITDNHNGSLSLVGIDPQSQPRVRRTYAYQSKDGAGRMVLTSFDTAPVELHEDLEKMVEAFGTNPGGETAGVTDRGTWEGDTWQGWTLDFDEPAYPIESVPYDFQRACREIGAAEAIKPYGSREGDLPGLFLTSSGPALDEVAEIVNGKKRNGGESDESYRARLAGGRDPYAAKPKTLLETGRQSTQKPEVQTVSKEHGPDSPAPNPNPHTDLPGLSSGPVTDPEGMLDRMRAEPTAEELETAARDIAPPFPGDEPKVPFGTGTIQDALKALQPKEDPTAPGALVPVSAGFETTTVHEPEEFHPVTGKPFKKTGKKGKDS